MNIFVKCWRGEAPLWQAFWLIGIIFPVEIAVIAGWIAQFFIEYFGLNGSSYLNSVILKLNCFAIITILLYMLFAYISIWRCRNNSGEIGKFLSIPFFTFVCPLLFIADIYLIMLFLMLL